MSTIILSNHHIASSHSQIDFAANHYVFDILCGSAIILSVACAANKRDMVKALK
jgi:hypothetical protein